MGTLSHVRAVLRSDELGIRCPVLSPPALSTLSNIGEVEVMVDFVVRLSKSAVWVGRVITTDYHVHVSDIAEA